MQNFHSPTFVCRFLNFVDRLSDSLGASVPAFVDLNSLRSLPPGTLGRTWADALDQANLLPLTTGPRRKQLHDGIHVLTGYGTDPIGEAEVQAFLLGTKFHLIHLVLGLGVLRWMGHQNLPPQQILNRLWRAYQQGDRAHFDVDTWQPERMWHLPLAEVQARFNIGS